MCIIVILIHTSLYEIFQVIEENPNTNMISGCETEDEDEETPTDIEQCGENTEFQCKLCGDKYPYDQLETHVVGVHGEYGPTEMYVNVSITKNLKCHLRPLNMAKAYHRRGLSQIALNEYELAKNDFLKVTELEPDNIDAPQKIKYCEHQLKLQKLNEKKMYAKMFDN